MIKLKDILEDFDFGDKLWADPGYASSSSRYRKLIDRMYNGATEKDTPQEREFWTAIQHYLELGGGGGVGPMTKWTPELDTLIKLKPKFPDMLDPASEYVKQAYRGMSMNVQQLRDMILKAGDIFTSDWTQDYLVAKVNTNLTSKNKLGFMSVSTDSRQAIHFSQGNEHRVFKNTIDRWPVVAQIPYSQVQDRALFTTKFTGVMTSFQEKEFWVVGDTIPVDAIMFRNPYQLIDSGFAARRLQTKIQQKNLNTILDALKQVGYVNTL